MARRSSCRGPTIHARILTMFEFVREKKRKGEVFRGKEAEGREREGFIKGDSPPLNCSD